MKKWESELSKLELWYESSLTWNEKRLKGWFVDLIQWQFSFEAKVSQSMGCLTILSSSKIEILESESVWDPKMKLRGAKIDSMIYTRCKIKCVKWMTWENYVWLVLRTLRKEFLAQRKK